MSIKNHLNKLLPEIIAKFPSIQVMYLFGSYASGTPKADSDADIAVFTDYLLKRIPKQSRQGGPEPLNFY